MNTSCTEKIIFVIHKYREELKQNAIKNEQMLVQIVEAIKNSGASSSNKEQKG